MNSAHMRRYRQRLGPTKWTDGSRDVSSYYWSEKYIKSHRKRPYGIVDPDMTGLLKDVETWEEDLSRCNSTMNTVHLSEDYDLFLGQPGPLYCKFPWCEDVCVDRRFWESLVCLDPPRRGWITDEHVELWVRYMWQIRPANADWAMVSSYFVQLLLQKSMPVWYANGKTYSIPWADVEQVLIPINEPFSHWLVAQFDIRTGVVTFYDSGETHKTEWRSWYVNMRDCLKVKLPYVLERTNVFHKKGIDPAKYTISFKNAERVPKQGGVFGDCGIWACIFLYRLSHCKSLDVEDPIQAALSYREQLARFYLKHKVVTW